jgi:glutathione S-transferase
MAYLDRKHPEPPIFGTSAEETGLIWKAISEFQSYVAPLVDRVIVPAFGIRPIDAADMQAAADELHGEFGRMEEAVSARGWLAVERLSAADLAVYPFVEALLRAAGKEAVRPMGLGFLPLAERHPALESWRQRVAGLPGYARTYPPHWREAA